MSVPPQLSRAPFLVLAGALCGGIVVIYRLGAPEWLAWVLAAIGGVGMAVCLLPDVYAGYSRGWLHWVPVAIAFMGLGMVTAVIHAPRQTPVPVGCIVSGTVEESVETNAGGSRLTVKLARLVSLHGGEASELGGKAHVYVDSVRARAGDRICLPAVFTELGGNEQYRSYLFSHGIDYVSYQRAENISIIPGGGRPWPQQWGDAMTALVDKSSLSDDSKAFVNALLFGRRSGMDPELKKEFSAAGVAHVLCVSGLHAGIVVLLLTVLLLPLDIVAGRNLRYLLTIAGVWIYVIVSGMGTPAVRAAVMASCVIVSCMLQRPRSAVNSLCLAAFVILLWDPRALFDAGFLLSFTVTAGIMLIVAPLMPPICRGASMLKRVSAWLIVPCVAFLCSWILSARYFHTVTLMFLPVNLLLVPLLPVYFGAALLHVALLATGVEWPLLCVMLDRGYDAFTSMTDFVSRCPGAGIAIWPHEATVWLYMAGMLLFTCALYLGGSRWWSAACGLMAAACISVLLLPSQMPADRLQLRGDRTKCVVQSTLHGDIQQVEIPGSGLSVRAVHGRTVVYADCDCSVKASGTACRKHCDWLVVGAGYHGPLRVLLTCIEPDSVLIHPAVSLDRRDELAAECQRSK